MTRKQSQSVTALVLIGLIVGALASTGFVTAVTASPSFLAGQSQTTQAPTEIDSCTTITDPGRYIMTTDIENSSQAACIQIRASDVVLDGRGHTLDGVQNQSRLRDFVNTSYTGIAPNATNGSNLTTNETANLSFPSPTNPEWANVGVAVNATDDLSNVSITALEVQEFVYGVYYDNVTAGTVQNVTIARNGDGLDFFNSSSLQVTSSRFTANQWGVYTLGMTDSTIRAINTSSNEQTGLYLYNSTMIDVENVTANDNGASGVIVDFTNESTLTAVTANRNRFGGIPLLGSSNNTVQESLAAGNGHDGISLQYDSNNNHLRNNTVANTTGRDSITANVGYAAGLLVTNSSSNNLIQNTVAYNNTNWTFYAVNTTPTTIVENLTIGERVSVSFTGADLAVDVRPDMTETVEGKIPRGLFIVNTTQDAHVEGFEVDWLVRSTTEEPPTNVGTPTTEQAENETVGQTTAETTSGEDEPTPTDAETTTQT